MSKDPSFPFYASDWLGSTRIALMDAIQERGLLRLLCHTWNSPDCALPDDADVLARLSLLGDLWPTKGAIVRDCFEPHPNKLGHITSPRLMDLRREREEWRIKSQRGGKNSADARQRSKGGSTTVPTTVPTKRQPPPQPNGNTPSPSPSPSPSSPPFSTPLIPLPGTLDCPEFRPTWDRWQRYLINRGGNGPTQDTLQSQLLKLEIYGVAEAIEILDTAITKGWAGPVFPKDRNGQKPSNGVTQL